MVYQCLSQYNSVKFTVSLVPSLSNRPPFLSASVRAATSIRKGAPARQNWPSIQAKPLSVYRRIVLLLHFRSYWFLHVLYIIYYHMLSYFIMCFHILLYYIYISSYVIIHCHIYIIICYHILPYTIIIIINYYYYYIYIYITTDINIYIITCYHIYICHHIIILFDIILPDIISNHYI